MKFGSSLSKGLREKYGRRSAKPRKGDTVKIVRGEYKDIEGKVVGVDQATGTVNVEGVTREKLKGGTSLVPIHSSNVVLTGLNLDDKSRKKRLEATA